MKKESSEIKRKRMIADFDKRGIPYLDTGIMVEEVEVVDELNYAKQPHSHQPFFRDPLKDFDDAIFESGFERPMIFEGEFTIVDIE